MKKIGNTLIISSLLLTFLLWILAKNSLSEITAQPVVAVNQIAALLGTILFVWSMILATRLDFLETLFGGMDKVYKIHRKVSEIGASLILLHTIALAISSSGINFRYFLPVHKNQSINMGVYSFWFFAATILLTLFIRKIKLPYHLWKQTHKFLNLAMVLALFHIISIPSDTSIFAPLGIWMYLVTGFGVASGIYMSFFYRWFGPKFKYEIVKIDRYGDIHDVYLKPINHKLHHGIAQYAYISFISKGVPKESHPYCITSLPEDELLRFSIKELGDYTKKLDKLKVGDSAVIYGPYGHLGERFDEEKNSVFIAGGIGIAPFISMFKKASLRDGNLKVNLFYCTKYKNEAVFEKELRGIADSNKNLTYSNQCSREPGGYHLTAEQVKDRVQNVKNTNLYLCGPSKMMLNLKKDLIKEGLLKENIILEDFEMI